MTPAWISRPIDAPSDDMMDAHTVAKLFGVSVDTLERMVKDGEFPQPLKIGRGVRVWEWRAVVYYRLKLEFLPRTAVHSGADEG